MSMSCLDALREANVRVDSSLLRSGENTSAKNFGVEDLTPWAEFNYSTLRAMFSQELAVTYHGHPAPRPLAADVQLFNETTVEDMLRRFIVPTVNYALERQENAPYFGRGGRCRNFGGIPDWSVTSDACLNEGGGYLNILPGDTKPSGKWSLELRDEKRDEWQKPIHQVMTYMTQHSSRYGFIITDKVLVVLRITREQVSSGIAADRSRRIGGTPVYTSHQRDLSDVSMPSQHSRTSSGSAYSDAHSGYGEYRQPEYKAIPWDETGNNRLTIKMALWCLAMMAARGERDIRCEYPSFKSWIRIGNGEFYNPTSGTTSSTLPGGHWAEGPSYEGLGSSSRSSGQASGSGQRYMSSTVPSAMEVFQAYEQPTPLTFSQPSQAATMRNLEYAYNSMSLAEDGSQRRAQAPVTKTASTEKKRLRVNIHKHTFSRDYYFINRKNETVETSKDRWRRVDGGYQLETREFVYFTKAFP